MVDYSLPARLERLARHEAGHCVAGIHRGYSVKVVRIGERADDGGYVDFHAKPNETAMDVLVRCLAGPIAACQHAGLRCPPPDFIQGSDARQIADALRIAYGYASCWPGTTNLYESAFAITAQILNNEWRAVRELAAMLLTYKTLTGPSVEEVVRQYELRGAA